MDNVVLGIDLGLSLVGIPLPCTALRSLGTRSDEITNRVRFMSAPSDQSRFAGATFSIIFLENS
jgi:hypothetical protein